MTALLALVLLAAAPSSRGAEASFERGQRAFRAGEYRDAARLLSGVPAKMPRTRDWALYLLGESEFYAGAYARARAAFTQLGRERASRLAPLGSWRAADCLWAE